MSSERRLAEIKIVGVIGAGQMGSGIAHVCATAGYEVRFHDRDPQQIAAGRGRIEAIYSRLIGKGVLAAGAQQAGMARIHDVDLAEVGTCDLVIEAATEDEAVKKEVFRTLTPHLATHTLLASNTSSISITRLASVTDRPERFIGLHFMYPAPVMKLVEIIRGIATDAPTYEAASAFAQSLGKTTANAEDFPAFIVNFFFIDMLN